MSNPAYRGSLLIVVAPSGAGKTSLVRRLLERREGMRLSISFTTRSPRPGERDGADYFFVTPEDFAARRDRGEFLEWALVHGNHYATSRAWIVEQMAAGTDIVLEIDWQGAAQIRRLFPDAVSVFVAPPSMQVLRERLTARGQDAPEVIERRMAAAKSELEHAWECQYVIINQDFAAACDTLVGIADAARSRFPQQWQRHPGLFAELGMTPGSAQAPQA
ncbi:MAG TPA: guanylate kinase [Burkholderiaceae bacterium]|nr:guanylate kinase [Burkholderiaceae bacterium]